MSEAKVQNKRVKAKVSKGEVKLEARVLSSEAKFHDQKPEARGSNTRGWGSKPKG